MAEYETQMKSFVRKLYRLGNDVASICEKGRKALSSSDQITPFFGMYTSLAKSYERFEDTWDEMYALSDTEGVTTFPSEKDKALFDNVKRYFYEANSNYVKLSRSDSSVGSPTKSGGSSGVNVTMNESSTSNLPKLSIPPFDGTILNWPKFKDVFCAIIHDDSSIPPVRKFHYLVRAVSGPAAAIVTKVPLTSENYAVAWEGLLKAYDKKRLLATAYLNELISFRPLQGKSNAASLQLFLSKVCENVSALQKLEIPDLGSFVLFYLAIKCLDQQTREVFETHCKDEFPKFDTLCDFIRSRQLALQLADHNVIGSTDSSTLKTKEVEKEKSYKTKSSSKTRASLLSNNDDGNNSKPSNPKIVCVVCKQNHTILNCLPFLEATAKQRVSWLQSWKGCKNCLSYNHVTDACQSKWSCRFCPAKHHSYLHVSKVHSSLNSTPQSGSSATTNPTHNTSAVNMSAVSIQESNVLLGTVTLEIEDNFGNFQSLRMVVDNGSQNTFLTLRCVQRLGLDLMKVPKKVSCLGNTSFSGVQGSVYCKLRPTGGDSELLTEALVVQKITSELPNFKMTRNFWERYTKYSLADPKFWESRPVDGLLGCDLVPDIWTGSIITVDREAPRLFSSIFGYVVMGRVPPDSALTSACFTESQETSSTVLFSAGVPDLQDELHQFWKLEEPPSFLPATSPEDDMCEDHFQKTCSRDPSGHYVVSLSFKSEPNFGPMHKQAFRSLENLEAKFRKNPDLAAQYKEFMKEYIELGHMEATSAPSKYILPHHCISKPDSPSKFRVVFNASAQSSLGSLNEKLSPGPKLQTDIKMLLLNFRIHKVVFVTDIVKMYRQILVNPDDRCYQHIYWRPQPEEKVQCYELKTLTYGLTNSPFLALRVIQQLRDDEGSHFPIAAKILCRDRYIDDFVTGAATIQEALVLQTQLIGILKRGGFELSKWSSNHGELLEAVAQNSTDEPVSLTPKDDATVKILGLQWHPESDVFSYNISIPDGIVTKRSMLSTVAKIYDPLGFLSPAVFLAKSFIQELWKSHTDWDDPVPETTKQTWLAFVQQLPNLFHLRIPRHLFSNPTINYQIVGFSDASEKGYSCSIYFRSLKENKLETHLIMAKSKLSPVKTVSIPRLELCGALLLATTYASLEEFLLRLPPPALLPRFFTDSTIVLGWLNTPTYKLKTFVANRVTQILESTSASSWAHVVSEENPSDCSSRGLMPTDILNHSLWWNGPYWLKTSSATWTGQDHYELQDTSELKPGTNNALIATTQSSCDTSWMTKFSSYLQLLRFSDILHRFIHNHRNPGNRKFGPLSTMEFRRAEQSCIKFVQLRHFLEGNFMKNRQVPMERFAKLSPFYDDLGVLRVGGRLKNADVSPQQKHPILLPQNCHFTLLLVDHVHRMNLHPGPGLLQALIQLKYWIPSLRRIARKRVFMCVICFKLRSSVKNDPPPMGELPACRVNISRAFQHTGVDFAGPLQMRDSLRRKSAISKVYICVFVCMPTKAVHLEAVTSLSTEAFLAAFTRFISRRGLPQKMYSDCGSNFRGAASQLKELEEWCHTEKTQNSLVQFGAIRGVDWSFIPSHAPHFGGLGEITVKGVKRHLHAVAGNSILTFEELTTLLARIECILNSRPLCPISSSPEEIDFLSPGHFLIGGHLMTNPEPTLLDVSENRLSRWQLVRRMSEHLWKRWQTEYLSYLQQRSKWTKPVQNLQEGDLVLLNDTNLHPLQWPLARVIAVHPGKDSLVRAATVRTATNVLRRPVVKLIPLLPLRVPAFDEES